MITPVNPSRRAFLFIGSRAVAAEAAPLARIAIVSDDCFTARGVYCMSCKDACEAAAIVFAGSGATKPRIDALACQGCGECVSVCPANAIRLAAAQAS